MPFGCGVAGSVVEFEVGLLTYNNISKYGSAIRKSFVVVGWVFDPSYVRIFFDFRRSGRRPNLRDGSIFVAVGRVEDPTYVFS